MQTNPLSRGLPVQRGGGPTIEGGWFTGGQEGQEGQGDWCQNGVPSTGVLAWAAVCGVMAPLKWAERPAFTAPANAWAISKGSCVSATAVLSSTASKPHSFTCQAWEGSPSPASTIKGTGSLSLSTLRACGLMGPRPVPMGAAHGITAWQPTSINFWHSTKSSVQ